MRARHIVVLLAGLALLAFGSASAEGPPTAPTAAATATAIRIVAPPQSDVVVSTVTAPGTPATGQEYAYPDDGSVLTAQSTIASASTKGGSATAESDVTAISLFDGVVKADAVTAKASADANQATADGSQDGGVVNLLVGGKPLGAGVKTVHLPMGTLVIGNTTVDRSAPAGASGYKALIVELDLRLSQPYAGLPAGAEIQIGAAQTTVQSPPAPAAATTTSSNEPPVGDRPTARPLPRHAPGGPLHRHPKLTAGRYVFPVYGPVSYIDSYGAARSDEKYHHGDDIFGRLGQPILAATDGTLFSVGFQKIGGYRLWLLDPQGNQFYYAHLSAYSTLAVNGAHVRAGQVIGFMGNTGDAEGTPVHLHFEIHPVSLLYLGYDGAVDPTRYLDAWKHQKDLPFPVSASLVAALPGGGSSPEPGAILLGQRDISSADGFDAAALKRALAAPAPATLMQTLVPTAAPHTAPAKDLGRG
ncbi:MAG TPA: M23 family metallopeptidase [Gaiellaceae bacterium]|nr:M23 family metallopeptidase [Gaiellaceae bacterium]